MRHKNWNQTSLVAIVDFAIVWGVLTIEHACLNGAIAALLSLLLCLSLTVLGYYSTQGLCSSSEKGRELIIGAGAFTMYLSVFSLFGLSVSSVRMLSKLFPMICLLLWMRNSLTNELFRLLHSVVPSGDKPARESREYAADEGDLPKRTKADADTEKHGGGKSGRGFPLTAGFPLLQQGMIVLLTILFLVRFMAPEEIADGTRPLLWAATLASGILILYWPQRKANLEFYALGFNLLWLLLTRFLLGELPARLFGVCWWGLLFFCFYSAGYHLEGRARRQLLKAVTWINVAVFVVWAAAGLWIALGGEIPSALPLLKAGVYFDAEGAAGKLVFIRYFGKHRNVTAAFFFLTLGMLGYQLLTSKGRWRKAGLVLLPVFYIAVALQHCRSVYLVTAFCLALTLGLQVYRKKADWNLLPSLFAAAAVSLAACVVFYSGFSICSNLISSVSQRHAVSGSEVNALPGNTGLASRPVPEQDADMDAVTLSSTEAEQVAQQEEAMQIVDKRNTIADAMTLTDRTKIWITVLPALKEQPKIAVEGQPENEIMDIINRNSGLEAKVHMHHGLLQQLILAGVPGFLLYLICFLALLFRILICCFDRTLPFHVQLLGILLLGFMVYGCFEPLLHWRVGYTSLFFILLSGCFVGESEDAYREREVVSP